MKTGGQRGDPGPAAPPFRLLLRSGPVRLRIVAAVLALATTAAGAAISLDAQLATLTVILAAMLVLERRRAATGAPSRDVTAG